MKNIRAYLVLLLLLCSTTVAFAQRENPISVSTEARSDLMYTSLGKDIVKGESGFKGYIFNLILKGEISPRFSYMYRQRLNSLNRDLSFFDSVDMMFLNYHMTPNLSLTAGKGPVFVGGWELDLAPIDCFFLSSFNYHYSPYQWGVSMAYAFPKDILSVQLCQSPFQATYVQHSGQPANLFAYSLKWYGRHGFYEPNWSVNMMEYAPGNFINYISLGNKFHIARNLQLELDYMNRAAKGHQFFAQDFTLVGKVNYQPIEKLNLYAKGTYDLNKTESDADLIVVKGTDIVRVGGGIEYYPLRNKNVRLHGIYSYSFGRNPQPQAFVRDNLSMLNIGVTWRVKVL